MARDTDVGGRPTGSLWRAPLAGGRSLDGWPDERRAGCCTPSPGGPCITNDPHVVEALPVANLPKGEPT